MNSLLNRLSLAMALVLIGAGAMLALTLQEFPRRLVEDFVVSRLRHDVDLLYVRVLDAADPDAAAQAATGTVYLLPLSGHYFIIHMPDGRSLRSRSLWDESLDFAAPNVHGEAIHHQPGPAGQQLLVFSKRFPAADGGFVVAVAEDVAAVATRTAAFYRQILLGLAAALVLLLLLQRRLLLRGLAPLQDAAQACRRLERGESTDLPASAPREVQPMLDAVDRLARHHIQRIGRVRHAVGNLSHALKTPLAVLQNEADELAAGGQPGAAQAIRQQTGRMLDIIELELRRARLAGSGPTTGRFELQAQLGALAAALQSLHAARAIRIELDLPPRTFAFDREDMLELFGNLLDNACKWAHGTVRLRVADRAQAPDTLHCEIEDDGPGVPDEFIARLGTAGLRTDEQRPGHGLGLAIVGDIVAQYGGTLDYGRAPELGGLRVTLRLPGEDLQPH